jgi:ribosomal protein L11 methyltransferase
MNTIQIILPALDQDTRGILIARLSESGYEGFEEEPLKGKEGGKEGEEEGEEEGEREREEAGGRAVLHAFIPERYFDPAALVEILAPWDLGYQKELIPEKNWNEEWEKNFHPVVVGEFCAVRASFHEPVAGVRHELVITPKMSFGTGHHATTFMMMEAMQGLDFAGKSVLDFGTGTGVLAILAERLGAERVLAIDHDDWSIANARENIEENRCVRIVLEKNSAIPSNELFSIILANINKNVLLQELDAMRQHLEEGGVILLSGLLQEDQDEIEKKAGQNNLAISYHGRITKGNWICLQLIDFTLF